MAAGGEEPGVKERSSVKILGILLTVLGVATLLYAVGYAMTAPGMARYYHQESFERTMRQAVIIARHSIFGLLRLASGIGLFMVKRWARWLAFISAAISVVAGLLSLVMDEFSLTSYFGKLLMLSWVWNGFLVWYLLRPSVKAQFQRGGRSSAFHS